MTEPQSQHEQAILLAVGGLVHREIAIDVLLHRIIDHISAAMNADRGTIYLVDRGKQEVFSWAAQLPEIEEIRLALGQGVAGRVAQTGQVQSIAEVDVDDAFYAGVDQQTGYRTRSILAVPMWDSSGTIMGVTQILNKRNGAFTDADVARLTRLAAQAAAAIEATTLYQDLARAPDNPLSPKPLTANFNGIVGGSPALRQACRVTYKVARTSASVLLRGESGSGKELFARAVHVNSPRSHMPLVKVDCAALPESLIDNELFGHERGAYTGASERGLGKFDVAHGGTLFLDEIGELPLAVQGKLLRVLQDREFLRIGGVEPVAIDVRVVAATNRDLEAMVAAGRFRRDLYFRIKVVQIELPPLRERGPADIERLCHHFVLSAAKRHGCAIPTLSRNALDRLGAYGWPGNVRELSNCIESAVIMMEGNVIDVDDLSLPSAALFGVAVVDEAHTPTRATLEEVERAHIARVLAACEGNQSEAAKALGIGRNTLARKLRRLQDD